MKKDMELYNSLEESLFRPFCTLDTAAAAIEYNIEPTACYKHLDDRIQRIISLLINTSSEIICRRFIVFAFNNKKEKRKR